MFDLLFFLNIDITSEFNGSKLDSVMFACMCEAHSLVLISN